MRSLLQLAGVSAALTLVCLLALDEPLARWIATRETWPQLWNDTIHYLEFPLGIEPYKWTGVWILVLGSIASLAILRLRFMAPAWVLVTLTHLLGRNLSFWVKTLTGRLRPSQWLKAGGGDTFFREGGYSFPSGHVILFSSVLLPLWLIYPRTRPLLAIVAFSMIARVMVNAHFLSDVFGGLAVTAAATWLCAVAVRRALPSQILPPSLR